MALQEILGKLGGQGGQENGLSNIQGLFGNSGLHGIVSQLTTSGMGQQVQSWIGNGDNQAVSGEQINQAVDPDALRQVSQQTGMSPDQVTDHVAQALPQLVDQATPDGQMPASDPLSSGSGSRKGMFSR